jgi:hypothetical protein
MPGGHGQAAAAGAPVPLPDVQGVRSPGLVAAVWWRAGKMPAGHGIARSEMGSAIEFPKLTVRFAWALRLRDGR